MKTIFLVLFLSILSKSISFRQDKSKIYSAKFKDVKCESFDNSTVVIDFCYLKAFSREQTFLNVGGTLLRSINSIFIQTIGFYRYNTVFRKIMESTVDFCGFMDGASNNILSKMICEMIAGSNPNLIHKCPYEAGKLAYYNITLDGEIGRKFQVFPEGAYK